LVKDPPAANSRSRTNRDDQLSLGHGTLERLAANAKKVMFCTSTLNDLAESPSTHPGRSSFRMEIRILCILVLEEVAALGFEAAYAEAENGETEGNDGEDKEGRA
jgi:hypothetical protein